MIDFKTAAEAVARIGTVYPNQGFTFQDLDGKEVVYTYPMLAKETERRAVALQRLGLQKGDRLGMVVIDPEQFVLTFLAAVRIGIIPVPVYPPLYLGRLESYFQQTEFILNSASTKILVVSSRLTQTLRRLAANVKTLERIVEVEQLLHGSWEGVLQECEVSPDDPVFLQYTSGSTMCPRGVIVTHRSLLSNVRAFVTSGLQVDPLRDKGVTWLPLFHDMGLVGFVLGPICCGVSVVFIPTMRFIKTPSVWMEAIHTHRGTISFAPNFAFNLAVVRRVDAARSSQWDLSCVKALGCGAEPIHPETLCQFAKLFRRYGLSPDAILPAYGLAEATLAVTMKPLGDPVRFRYIERSLFEGQGVAKEVRTDTWGALVHVSCGVPLPGYEVAIVNRSGKLVAECVEGEICLRGPSIAAGYIGNAEEFKIVMRNGWFHTGDLGYFAQGELYVTGRIKDLIIINGRNVHPQTIEWVASTVQGVKQGSVAAFSRTGLAGEELVLVVEARNDDITRIVSAIEVAVQQATLTKPADIVCIKPGSLPRTSSGKVKRHQVRQQYLTESLWSQAKSGESHDRDA
jgi:fatty-acyl-CoA synthase